MSHRTVYLVVLLLVLAPFALPEISSAQSATTSGQTKAAADEPPPPRPSMAPT